MNSLINFVYLLNKFVMTDAFSFMLFEKYILYIFLMSILSISYFIVMPLIKWLVSLYSIRLLSYLVSSLIVVIIILLLKDFRDDLQGGLFNVLEIALQCLGAFGLVLFVYHVTKHFIYKAKEKKQLKT